MRCLGGSHCQTSAYRTCSVSVVTQIYRGYIQYVQNQTSAYRTCSVPQAPIEHVLSVPAHPRLEGPPGVRNWGLLIHSSFLPTTAPRSQPPQAPHHMNPPPSPPPPSPQAPTARKYLSPSAEVSVCLSLSLSVCLLLDIPTSTDRCEHTCTQSQVRIVALALAVMRYDTSVDRLLRARAHIRLLRKISP